VFAALRNNSLALTFASIIARDYAMFHAMQKAARRRLSVLTRGDV
jgi:hypothetical protein